ncbi:MAG TPA: hypothetical protein VHO24_02590 [Opitutaceae bacterium]|nr:hypothetical protein [Opitutaceae bacterium]
MKTRPASFIESRRRQPTRGSVLITSLIFALIIAITLVSYLKLATQSLKLSHRTFFADAADNLAEVGLEEAVWSFNQLGASTSSTAIAAAWSGWTLGNTIADAYVSSAGSGYTSAPTVTISGGGGSGALATATITTYYQVVGGVLTAFTGVTNINITNPGTGYTSAPTITLSGGGGTLAAATARLAATRTFTFSNLDQKATGVVKVWVAGYDGTAVVPIVVAKATITPQEGPPIQKFVKVILSKNGVLPKGVVAKNGINWNGRPFADSFVSSGTPGVPPLADYDITAARANTTLASLNGPQIDLSNGTVSGNVMTGPGVTVTGHGTITGAQIGNFTYNFAMPTYPSTAGYSLGSTLPAVLPRPEVRSGATTLVTAAEPASGRPAVYSGGTLVSAADAPAADGYYYYYVNGATIGDLTITAGKKVVIVGTGNTNMVSGLKIPSDNSPAEVGSLKIYMDGGISLAGNDKINRIASPNASWAGALEVYTTTTSALTFSGNAAFVGCIFAPNASLVGNGGGHEEQDLIGSFVVGSITSNGHMTFHYDEGLGSTPNPKPWGLALWTELYDAADRALYAPKLAF